MISWQSPRSCTVNGCPEVGRDGDEIVVRNSHHPEIVLRLSLEEWAGLLVAIKDGEYDQLPEETT